LRRYQEDGFDLDLTYITDRIIAMGFPSSKGEAMFRNPLTEVAKFFEKRHAYHYKLYNLCAEKRYDPSRFNIVAEYPFSARNTPPIKLIQECLTDVENFLAEDPRNTVGINCKAGKGRTGLIICCYLLHSGICASTDEALEYYGRRRTKDGKGVTIASQIRYIRYYEVILKELNSVIPPAPKIILSKLIIPISAKIAGQPLAWIEINNIVTHRSAEVTLSKKQKGYELIVDGMCEGDCKIQIVHKQGRKVTKVCHFWFNSGFVDPHMDNKFSKAVIDVANKDKKCKIFKNDFIITPVFRAYDPKTEKEPEEKFNNWLKYSLAKEKEKKRTVAPIEGVDDLNDTEDSSIELKAEDDGDAAFVKKEEEKAAAEKTDKVDKAEKAEPGETEEKGGREKSRSIYKTDGYNLDLDLTESDTESVDCSDEEIPNGDGITITVQSPPQPPQPAASNNTPITTANNTPITTASNNTPIIIASNNTPIITASNNTPIIIASNNTPIIIASNNTPITNNSKRNKGGSEKISDTKGKEKKKK